MREILFRGKRTDNVEWIEGFYSAEGLTDKNGVRIFEGDIVKGIAYSVERIGVIVWIDEIASFGVRYFKSVSSTAWENSSILRCASMGKTDEFAAEIIGNIHDNPELLEGGEGDGII